MLTDLDRELERRGLAFVRYADDCNLYVGRRVAGERVMRGIRAYLKDVLRLRINERKSAVARPWERKFLGYTCTVQRKSRLRIAPESVRRLKHEVRERMRRGRGQSLRRTIEELNSLLRGWINYFQLAQSKGVLEELDHAERARVSAVNGHGPWWNAGASHLHQALPARYFTRMGLVSLLPEVQRLQGVR